MSQQGKNNNEITRKEHYLIKEKKQTAINSEQEKTQTQ